MTLHDVTVMTYVTVMTFFTISLLHVCTCFTSLGTQYYNYFSPTVHINCHCMCICIIHIIYCYTCTNCLLGCDNYLYQIPTVVYDLCSFSSTLSLAIIIVSIASFPDLFFINKLLLKLSHSDTHILSYFCYLYTSNNYFILYYVNNSDTIINISCLLLLLLLLLLLPYFSYKFY